MAKIGLKYLAWAKIKTESTDALPTYDTGRVLGKMISSNLSVTNSEGKLYADDALAEYINEFSSAEFTAETDNIALEDQAALYGATYVDDELQHYSDDNAPYGGYAGYQALSIRNKRKYRTWFFAKGKASVPDESNSTKGESISFGNQPLKVTIAAPDYGPWKRVKEFDTEAAAKAWCDNLLNVAAWHSINVQVNGTGSASPVGTTAVADGKTFTLTIEGTPAVLNDNGADVTASISDGVYTLTNVSADHSISVIYSA